MYTRIEEERLKLYKDKGASSLRNNTRFHLYARKKASSSEVKKEPERTLVQRFRKFSNAIVQLGAGYNRHYDSNSGDEGPSGFQPRRKKSKIVSFPKISRNYVLKNTEPKYPTFEEVERSSTAYLGYSLNGSFYDRSKLLDLDIERLENGELSDESEIDDNSYVNRSSSSSAGSQGDVELSSDDENY